MGLFDKRTPEEKAADIAHAEAAKKAQTLASRTCPLRILFETTDAPNESRCEGSGCRWWSQSSKECYVILACKKMLGEA